NSQGVQLLEKMVQEYGPIFNIGQIYSSAENQQFPEDTQLSSRQIQKLISKLASAGWIEIIKRGTYIVKSPLYAGEIHPYAIAAALVQPMAISHWSALAYHGFTTQSPVMIQASTPHKVVTPEMRLGKAYNPRGRAAWRAFDLEFEFIYTKKESFWGFQRIWVSSWQQVNITDPERTALDLITRPDIFGGISSASEILEACISQINVDRLVSYALRYNVGTVIKRLGWLLEKMGVSSETLNSLQNHPVRGYTLLDPTQPKSSKLNPYWQINENLRT
ncbi:MAG: type IV toxin-antitoxin system AbiEi family antitoxin, partial [Chloroflexota bacterium]